MGVRMTLWEIFEADFTKNHANREYSREDARKAIQAYLDGGGEHFDADLCFAVFRDRGDFTAEFHCFNAGDGRVLVKTVDDMATALAGRFSRMVTYHDNPRINEIAAFLRTPHRYSRIDQGIDRTYELVLYTRS